MYIPNRRPCRPDCTICICQGVEDVGTSTPLKEDEIDSLRKRIKEIEKQLDKLHNTTAMLSYGGTE